MFQILEMAIEASIKKWEFREKSFSFCFRVCLPPCGCDCLFPPLSAGKGEWRAAVRSGSCLWAFASTRTWSAILSLSCRLKSDQRSEALTSSLLSAARGPFSSSEGWTCAFSKWSFLTYAFQVFLSIFFLPCFKFNSLGQGLMSLTRLCRLCPWADFAHSRLLPTCAHVPLCSKPGAAPCTQDAHQCSVGLHDYLRMKCRSYTTWV